MPALISVVENSLITSAEDGGAFADSPRGTVVDETVFEALRQVAVDADGVNELLSFFIKKGRKYIRVQHYVGLLTLPDGTQLEIIPKIGREAGSRSMLLAMLRYLRYGPFRALTSAHTQAAELPLWDVFVTAFLDTLEVLLRQGVQRSYVSVDRNEHFWKGKFQATRQQRENAQHAERLAVLYDTFTADMPANRLMKTTLQYLQVRTTNPGCQQRIRQFSWALDEIPASASLSDDWRATKRTNRVPARYEPALRWAEALLGRQAYGVKTGPTPDLSLLFPMERVFEDFVAHGIQRYWPNPDSVTLQESSAHLVNEHVGTPKFKLRPDILIRQNGWTLVLDTKWKELNGTDRTGNYGIDQADLYQLFAYGKKYSASDLFLVYPANESFRKPLPFFDYDLDTRLHVVPFDVVSPLANEVEKMAAYALAHRKQ